MADEGNRASVVSTSILTVVVLVVLLYVIYELYMNYGSPGTSGGGSIDPARTRKKTDIIGNYTMNNSLVPVTIPNGKFPRSSNQATGIEFSYALWMSVQDWSPPTAPNDNTEGVVFIKGVPAAGNARCPAMTVRDGSSSSKNSIHFYTDIFDNGRSEKVSIYNLPSSTVESPIFFHVALVVTEEEMKVYINGTVAKIKTFGNIPRQNESSLYFAPGGSGKSFKGEVGNFAYYNYSLSQSEIDTLVKTPPKQDTSNTAILPPYHADSWYFNTDYSRF